MTAIENEIEVGVRVVGGGSKVLVSVGGSSGVGVVGGGSEAAVGVDVAARLRPVAVQLSEWCHPSKNGRAIVSRSEISDHANIPLQVRFSRAVRCLFTISEKRDDEICIDNSFCSYCNQPVELIWVHSHYQCPNCKIVVISCCGDS